MAEFADPPGPLPLPGSPAWCALDEKGKTASCLAASAWWAFEHAHRDDLLDELGQLAALKQAALAIADSEDWERVAQRRRRGLSSAYIPRAVS